jgi:hypothetical protein
MLSRKTVIHTLAGAAALTLGGAVALAPLSFGNDGIENHIPRSPLEAGPEDHPYSDGVVDPKGGPGLGLDIPSAADRVLSGEGMDAVRSVEEISLGSSPEEGLPRLRLTIAEDSLEGPGRVQATWLGSISQGAIGELIRTDQVAINQVLGHSEIYVVSPSGSRTLYGNLGFVATGQEFSDANLSDADLISRTKATLASFGLSALDVQILRPLGAAMFIRVSRPDSEDPQWTIDELLDAIGGTPRTLEGLCLEIDSTSGKPLLAGAAAYRTGLGSLWFTDGQDERFNALHG